MRQKSTFGSSDTLEQWLGRFDRSDSIPRSDKHFTPIDCDGRPDDYPSHSRIQIRRSDQPSNTFQIFVAGEVSPLLLMKSWETSTFIPSTRIKRYRPSVSSAWAEAKYASPSIRNISTSKYDLDDSISTCDPAGISETPVMVASPDGAELRFSIIPPFYVTPSRNCSVCGSSLISARAVVKPPGYCEYSGTMICGDCFHSREVVVPWKLVQGFETFRGNVSRKSAGIIHANFYAVCIPYSELSGIPAVRLVQTTRIRCQTFRPKIRACDSIGKSVVQVIAPLPAHLRDEILGPNSQSCLDYCLADLVDIVGGSSIIGRTLMGCLNVLESHCCSDCDRMFSRICIVCTTKVSCTDIEWTYCDDCESWFHRTCHGRCIGGCPVCANREPLRRDFSIDDISDLVVSS